MRSLGRLVLGWLGIAYDGETVAGSYLGDEALNFWAGRDNRRGRCGVTTENNNGEAPADSGCEHCNIAERRLADIIKELKDAIPADEPQHLYTSLLVATANYALDTGDDALMVVDDFLAILRMEKAKREQDFHKLFSGKVAAA